MLFKLSEETRTYVLMLVPIFESAEGMLSALFRIVEIFCEYVDSMGRTCPIG
jgi:hypothetical protein